jgi:hypothetical protein
MDGDAYHHSSQQTRHHSGELHYYHLSPSFVIATIPGSGPNKAEVCDGLMEWMGSDGGWDVKGDGWGCDGDVSTFPQASVIATIPGSGPNKVDVCAGLMEWMGSVMGWME